MRLLTQLTAAGVMLATAGILVSVALISSSSSLHFLAAQLADAVESVHAAEQTERALLVHNRQSSLYRSTGRLEHRRERDNARQQITFWLKSMQRFVSSSHEQNLLDTATAQVKRYMDEWEKLDDSSPNGQETTETLTALLDDAQATLSTLVELNYEQSQEFQKSVEVESRRANIIGIGSTAGVAILLAGVFLLLQQGLRNPLVRLKQQLQHVEAGNLTPIHPDGPAELQEIASIFNDLLHRVKTQRESQLRFLAGVAHDLRTPLNAMKLCAEGLAYEDSPEEQRKMVEIISRQVTQLERQVGDLLDTARVESGHLDLRPAEHDVVGLVETIAALFRGTSSRHRLHINRPPEPLPCRCDSTRIGQVLTNLISNAIKYSPSGGDITVTLTASDGYAVVSVSDEGIGIKSEDLPHIFEPFRRTASTREAIPGIGLGLSVSRRIAEAHGGDITVTSKPGLGSTFTLRLPCA